MPRKKFIACVPPPDHPADAFELARVAVAENPANAPPIHALATLTSVALIGTESDAMPQFIAVMTSKYWGPKQREFGVSFLEQTGPTTRGKILAAMNLWSEYCGVSFRESSQGEVRISRQGGQNGGYWSYMGTDILSIPSNKPTMNLEAFTENTPESEYLRVVCHETGHTLGCPHEHMRRAIIERIDPEKAVAYFRRTTGWSRQAVIEQVLTPVEESSLMGTATAEQDSIMAYTFPASITVDGKPIVGGTDITSGDFAFMSSLYPKTGAPVQPPVVVVQPPIVVPPIQPVEPPVVAKATRYACSVLASAPGRANHQLFLVDASSKFEADGKAMAIGRSLFPPSNDGWGNHHAVTLPVDAPTIPAPATSSAEPIASVYVPTDARAGAVPDLGQLAAS